MDKMIGHHKQNKNFGKLPDYVLKFRNQKYTKDLEEWMENNEEQPPIGTRLVLENER